MSASSTPATGPPRLVSRLATLAAPLFFRAIAGDQDPPPASFADPNVSGGLITDAGYHDLYLARWLMADEVTRAYAEGEALVDPALGAVWGCGQCPGRFSVCGAGRWARYSSAGRPRYGHDVRVEIVGEEGALHVGYLRQTPVKRAHPAGRPSRCGARHRRSLCRRLCG